MAQDAPLQIHVLHSLICARMCFGVRAARQSIYLYGYLLPTKLIDNHCLFHVAFINAMWYTGMGGHLASRKMRGGTGDVAVEDGAFDFEVTIAVIPCSFGFRAQSVNRMVLPMRIAVRSCGSGTYSTCLSGAISARRLL